ncbi:hypothetical protein [Planosporangium mesophilum]|uniref:Uncharacterized protein n=1 Tax=Planosporangium mesophilum TaxID=689768 RepID=A0A8J3TEH3_9ACTN|nr:hypothetical protein [Planosporangium mesophilum]NJC82606.1 hypothetical protein [Planosporangium mesophilum]GII24973.1 hypothetical protein Pme01_45700 [Planosporangium mesophilum]
MADDDHGSWHLRGTGAWIFAAALWLAGLGGTVLYSQDAAEIGWARLRGVPGVVTIENCAHSGSYALCYGPFDATDGSVRVKRVELRTLRNDGPGRHERTWLPSRTARHAWAGDIGPWRELLPAVPFALLASVQTVWLATSWRAWRRSAVTLGSQDPPQDAVVGGDRQPPGWQDLRGTAAPPSPSTPPSWAGSQPWETSGHG